jgi:hypothetical protein
MFALKNSLDLIVARFHVDPAVGLQRGLCLGVQIS